MNKIPFLLFAFAVTACASSTGWAKDTPICTNTVRVDVIRGEIHANPDDDYAPPPDIDPENTVPPRVGWTELNKSKDLVTVRCYPTSAPKNPTFDKALPTVPEHVILDHGTVSYGNDPLAQ